MTATALQPGDAGTTLLPAPAQPWPELPMLRLQLEAQTCAPLRLPPFAGSMLRGALGHALLRFSPLPHRDHKPCLLYGSCPYCTLFVTPPIPGHHLKKLSQLPHPYVIEPPPGARTLDAGEQFAFSLVLFGRAVPLWQTVLRALASALHAGLTADHVRCRLRGAWHGDTQAQLWPGTHQPDLLALPAPLPLHRSATLRFDTPLRLRRSGRPVRDPRELDARTLLVALARRYQLMLDAWAPGQAPQLDFQRLVASAEAIRLQAGDDLRWFDWGRYSQRQRREMQLGGLLGSLQLHGDLMRFSRLLHLGQWLHVGRNTTFGMGGYRLIPDGSGAASASTLTAGTGRP